MASLGTSRHYAVVSRWRRRRSMEEAKVTRNRMQVRVLDQQQCETHASRIGSVSGRSTDRAASYRPWWRLRRDERMICMLPGKKCRLFSWWLMVCWRKKGIVEIVQARGLCWRIEGGGGRTRCEIRRSSWNLQTLWRFSFLFLKGRDYCPFPTDRYSHLELECYALAPIICLCFMLILIGQWPRPFVHLCQ